MKYHFYKQGDFCIDTECEKYPGIKTPDDLYEALRNVWSADTAAPRLRHLWSKDNPTVGQCSVTSFLAQDIFGGDVYGIPRENNTFHCFNVVGACVFDLTSEQFGAEQLDYAQNVMQSRAVHFAKQEKLARYELLKSRLAHFCSKKIQIV